mmetsp:Transcript_33536/g.54346  ORF Transcript_33536/g.54346 Transcript_33536/m.54346 type:complete len:195 (+) Transcript_33536:1826-2410(+)
MVIMYRLACEFLQCNWFLMYRLAAQSCQCPIVRRNVDQGKVQPLELKSVFVPDTLAGAKKAVSKAHKSSAPLNSKPPSSDALGVSPQQFSSSWDLKSACDICEALLGAVQSVLVPEDSSAIVSINALTAAVFDNSGLPALYQRSLLQWLRVRNTEVSRLLAASCSPNPPERPDVSITLLLLDLLRFLSGRAPSV